MSECRWHACHGRWLAVAPLGGRHAPPHRHLAAALSAVARGGRIGHEVDVQPVLLPEAVAVSARVVEGERRTGDWAMVTVRVVAVAVVVVALVVLVVVPLLLLRGLEQRGEGLRWVHHRTHRTAPSHPLLERCRSRCRCRRGRIVVVVVVVASAVRHLLLLHDGRHYLLLVVVVVVGMVAAVEPLSLSLTLLVVGGLLLLLLLLRHGHGWSGGGQYIQGNPLLLLLLLLLLVVVVRSPVLLLLLLAWSETLPRSLSESRGAVGVVAARLVARGRRWSRRSGPLLLALGRDRDRDGLANVVVVVAVVVDVG